MIELEDVIKYLKENLEIEVEQLTEFGPIEEIIKVRLVLDDKVISESDCTLPESDEKVYG